MRTPLLLLTLLVAFFSGVVKAQDVTGTWQGTLQAGKDLRVVFRISKAEGGGLSAVMYSIDQGSQGFPASSVTLQGPTVRMSIAALGGVFEGRLSADNNSMAGNWTQGQGRLPLNLVRTTSEAAWAIPEAPAPPKPMAANAAAAFEVATIKPSQPNAQGKAFMVKGRQFFMMNTSLSDIITFAYGIHARQITGGPPWIESDRYDVTAKPEGDGQPNEAQWKAMVQKLLADRFRLAFHRDKRELPVYVVTVSKTGPKLTKSQGDPNGLPGLFFRGLGILPAVNATMADLAGVMQSAVLDRPVVDQTGIAGRYDFTLTWTPDEFQFGGLGTKVPPPADPSTAPPNLFTAMQEQLGLRLETTRAPAEVFVIDRVEKPSQN